MLNFLNCMFVQGQIDQQFSLYWWFDKQREKHYTSVRTDIANMQMLNTNNKKQAIIQAIKIGKDDFAFNNTKSFNMNDLKINKFNKLFCYSHHRLKLIEQLAFA